MEERNSKVYYLSSSESPREIRYVGITVKTLEDRLRRHILDIRKPTYRTNWIQNVISSGHKVLITLLEGGLTLEESKTSEVYYIAKFREWGYNLTNTTSGGNNTEGWKISEGRLKSNKIRRKVRVKRTKEEKFLAQSLAQKERYRNSVHPSTGRIISEETRKKLIESHLGQRNSDESYKKASATRKANKKAFKPVLQYSKEGNLIAEYESGREAERITGITYKNISQVCIGNKKTCMGYIWKFKNGE